ncbi:unnamed protein product [Amoebophrya sp. A25]|nr:unnamed protein product [Amoebophrya sp. A25]|eukprot:GSA25T00026078001.1
MTEFLWDLGIPGVRIPALTLKKDHKEDDEPRPPVLPFPGVEPALEQSMAEMQVGDLLGFGFRVVEASEAREAPADRFLASTLHDFYLDKVPGLKCKDITLGKRMDDPVGEGEYEVNSADISSSSHSEEEPIGDGSDGSDSSTEQRRRREDINSLMGTSDEGSSWRGDHMSERDAGLAPEDAATADYYPEENGPRPAHARPDVELMRRVRGRVYLHPAGFEILGLASSVSVHIDEDVSITKASGHPLHRQKMLANLMSHDDIILQRRNSNDPCTDAERRYPKSAINALNRFEEECEDYVIADPKEIKERTDTAFQPLNDALAKLFDMDEFQGMSHSTPGRSITATIVVPVLRVTFDPTLDTADRLVAENLVQVPYFCDGVILGAKRRIRIQQYSTYPKSPSGFDMNEHFSTVRQHCQEQGRDATISTPRSSFRSGRAGPLGFPPEVHEAAAPGPREVDVFFESECLHITVELLHGETLPKFDHSGDFLAWLKDWSSTKIYDETHLWKPLLVNVLHTDSMIQRLLLRHQVPAESPHHIPQYCLGCRCGRKLIHWNLDLYRASRALPPRYEYMVDRSCCPDPIEEHTVIYFCPSFCSFYSCSQKSHEERQRVTVSEKLTERVEEIKAHLLRQAKARARAAKLKNSMKVGLMGKFGMGGKMLNIAGAHSAVPPTGSPIGPDTSILANLRGGPSPNKNEDRQQPTGIYLSEEALDSHPDATYLNVPGRGALVPPTLDNNTIGAATHLLNTEKPLAALARTMPGSPSMICKTIIPRGLEAAKERRIPLIVWGSIKLQPKGRDEVLEENAANLERVQKAKMLLSRQALGLPVPKSCMSIVPAANRREMLAAGVLGFSSLDLLDEEDQAKKQRDEGGEGDGGRKNKVADGEEKNFKPLSLMILGTLSRVFDVEMKNLRLGLQIRKPTDENLLFWILSDYARVSIMGPDEDDLDLMDRLEKDEMSVIAEEREKFRVISDKLQEMNGRRINQEGWYQTQHAQVVECSLRSSEKLDEMLRVLEPCPNNCGERVDKLFKARRRLHLYRECRVQARLNMLNAAGDVKFPKK